MAKKKNLNPKDSWSSEGVERRLKSLELVVEGWEDPNIDVAPGADDIGNLKTGIDSCHKLLEDLRILLAPKDPPPGWWPEKAVAHGEKVRQKLAEIDGVIQDLNSIEDRITELRN